MGFVENPDLNGSKSVKNILKKYYKNLLQIKLLSNLF